LDGGGGGGGDASGRGGGGAEGGCTWQRDLYGKHFQAQVYQQTHASPACHCGQERASRGKAKWKGLLQWYVLWPGVQAPCGIPSQGVFTPGHHMYDCSNPQFADLSRALMWVAIVSCREATSYVAFLIDKCGTC
jgi:hypothetical protein